MDTLLPHNAEQPLLRLAMIKPLRILGDMHSSIIEAGRGLFGTESQHYPLRLCRWTHHSVAVQWMTGWATLISCGMGTNPVAGSTTTTRHHLLTPLSDANQWSATELKYLLINQVPYSTIHCKQTNYNGGAQLSHIGTHPLSTIIEIKTANINHVLVINSAMHGLLGTIHWPIVLVV